MVCDPKGAQEYRALELRQVIREVAAGPRVPDCKCCGLAAIVRPCPRCPGAKG